MSDKLKKDIIIDEKSFDLSLSGGPIHTDLLFATASLKEECIMITIIYMKTQVNQFLKFIFNE